MENWEKMGWRLGDAVVCQRIDHSTKMASVKKKENLVLQHIIHGWMDAACFFYLYFDDYQTDAAVEPTE